MKLFVLDLHLDEVQVDCVESHRGPDKLSTSKNIVFNAQNRMARENIENASTG